MHKRQHFVSLEHFLVTCHQGIESFHVTLLDEVHDLIVGEQILLEIFLIEDLSVWDLTHQKFNND